MLKDIFISYAREDVEITMCLARALSRHGYSVWWDEEIRAGEPFANVIEKNLAGSRCVVVLWTESAYASFWVRKEASAGAQRGMLIPLLLANDLPPLEFRHLNATKITNINADLGKILREVETKLGPKTYALRRSFKLPKHKEPPTGIAVSKEAVWTSIFTGDLRAQSEGYPGDISGRIYAIDLETGTVVSTLEVNPGLRDLVFACDAVWGLCEKVPRAQKPSLVMRIDLTMKCVDAAIDVPCEVGKIVSGNNTQCGHYAKILMGQFSRSTLLRINYLDQRKPDLQYRTGSLAAAFCGWPERSD